MKTKNQYFQMNGIALFPKTEFNKDTKTNQFKFCLAIDEESGITIDKLCEQANAELDIINLSEVIYGDKTYLGLNVKSGFDVPVFDKNGKQLEDNEIYHGAKVRLSLAIKEYTFGRKKGLTCYVKGAVVFEQGEPTSVTFDSIMNGFEGEDIPF